MAFIPRVIEKFLDMINLQRHNDNYADIKTELDKSEAHIGNLAIHTTQAEKNKLAGIQSGAQVNTVNSVAGRTGNVVIGWEDVGSKPSSSPANIDDAVAKRHEHSNKAVLDATTASFTSAEKTKLAGVATGAEVNQNAFSNINGIAAQNTTDALEIVGDIGITVTTDPANKKVKLTVTGEAAPGAHATTHLSGGSDPIPAATLSTGGLMSAQDKQDLAAAKTAIAEGQTIPAPISRGVNVIQSDQASGATFSVLGCTLCNILGSDGGFAIESTVAGVAKGWSKGPAGAYALIDTGGGTKAQEIISSSAETDRWGRLVIRSGVRVTLGKRYVLIVRLSVSAGALATIRVDHSGIIGPEKSSSESESLLFIKFSPTTDDPATIRIFNSSHVGVVGSIRASGARLFEISAADDAAIGTTITGEVIDRRWPYVDSVQHLRGLSVLMPGKNLLPPFLQWTAINANFTIQSPYKAVLVAPSTTNQITSIDIPVVIGQTYHVHHKGTGRVLVHKGKGTGGTIISSPAFTVDASFNGYACVRLDNAITAGTFTFEDVQLELGAAATSFAPYSPSYAHADTILASTVDRSIADSYDSATGQVFRRWKTGVKTEASFTWIVQDHIGFKRISATNFLAANSFLSEPQTLYNYAGKVLVRNSSADTVDSFHTQTSNGALHICISDNESGWAEAINPSANAIKALMNGWKANGNNGSVYNSWVSILTGAAPVTNTEAYVAANKAPGWDAYATLDYVRATPVTETLSGDLGGLAMVKGGNTVELLEGVVSREKVNPVLSGGLYYINDTNLPVSKLDYRAERVLAVYKGAEIDPLWRIQFGAGNAYGSGKAVIAVAEYDPAAEYYVDYIVMDKHAYTANAVDATLVYRSTLGGAVAQATQDIARLTAQMGVHEWKLLLDEAYAANIRRDFDAHAGAGGSAHALATTSAAGFMSATDKAAVDAIADQIRTISMGGMV